MDKNNLSLKNKKLISQQVLSILYFLGLKVTNCRIFQIIDLKVSELLKLYSFLSWIVFLISRLSKNCIFFFYLFYK